VTQSRHRTRVFLVLVGIAVLLSAVLLTTRALALAGARRELAPYQSVLAPSGLSARLMPTHWLVGYDTYDGYCCSGCYLRISFLGKTIDKPESGLKHLDHELRGLGKLCARDPAANRTPFVTAQAHVEWHGDKNFRWQGSRGATPHVS
jgi:hypothetical protein